MASIVMLPANSSFIESGPHWGENVAKSVIFKIPRTFFLALLFKLFAFCTYCRGDYTSFLMLSEGLGQKMIFVLTRSWSRGVIILMFVSCCCLAGFYDTILWGLDAPGHTKLSGPKFGNGKDFPSDLLPNPPYVTVLSNPSGDANQIDVDKAFMSNLFRPEFDFSFPPGTYARVPNVLHPQKLMDPLPTGPGPRIYPDDGSFTIGFAPDLLSFNTASGGPCTTTKTEDKTVLLWNCDIPIITSLSIFRKPAGVPLIWWDDDHNQTTYLLPDKHDNFWASVGTEGGTVIMKQVITVTKGARRHTFLQTTWKTSMLTRGTFPDDEIKTMLRRVYAPGGESGALQIADGYTQRCLDAQKNGLNSTTMGSLFQDPEGMSIGWNSTEFFNLPDDVSPQVKKFGLLRLHNTTIEFVRSETVPPVSTNNEVKTLYTKGGKTKGDDYPAYTMPTPGVDHQLNQIDTSAVVLITGILGNGRNDTNVVALNATGMNWYSLNELRINQLLLSRAFLVGGDASTVDVLVYKRKFAISLSLVQILLIVLPIVLSIVAFLMMRLRDQTGLYRSSLLATLFAKTFSGYHPYDLILVRSDGYTQVGVKDGSNTTYIVGIHKLSLSK